MYPTIQDNLNRLTNAKINICNAITRNGGNLSTGRFEGFSNDINNRFDEVNDDLERMLNGTNSRNFYSLPGTFTTSNNTLNNYTIYGNMNQDGTPTPDNPIYPTECGDKTENLFDTFDIVGQVPTISDGQLINYTGSTTSLMPIISGDISVTKPTTALVYLMLYAANQSYIGYVQNSTDSTFYGTSITGYENAKYYRLRIDRTTGLDDIQIMINTGSTAKPYEPYGYKLPITLNINTYPVYLSEPIRKIGDYADTIEADGTVTRRIEKLVFTGRESWQKSTDYTYYVGNSGYERTHAITIMSTHYLGQNNVISDDPIAEGSCCFYYGIGADVLYVKNITPYSTIQDFKAWVAAQYAAGTPVTVWYVLSTARTETITTPTISTIIGQNTIDINTTLKPYQFYIEYNVSG